MRVNLVMNTLQGTNISHPKALLEMIFLFPRWDMLVPQWVCFVFPPFPVDIKTLAEVRYDWTSQNIPKISNPQEVTGCPWILSGCPWILSGCPWILLFTEDMTCSKPCSWDASTFGKRGQRTAASFPFSCIPQHASTIPKKYLSLEDDQFNEDFHQPTLPSHW